MDGVLAKLDLAERMAVIVQPGEGARLVAGQDAVTLGHAEHARRRVGQRRLPGDLPPGAGVNHTHLRVQQAVHGVRLQHVEGRDREPDLRGEGRPVPGPWVRVETHVVAVAERPQAVRDQQPFAAGHLQPNDPPVDLERPVLGEVGVQYGHRAVGGPGVDGLAVGRGGDAADERGQLRAFGQAVAREEQQLVRIVRREDAARADGRGKDEPRAARL